MTTTLDSPSFATLPAPPLWPSPPPAATIPQATLDLRPPAASAWEFRDFEGYRQAREDGRRWRFYVSDFGCLESRPGAELCMVLRSDGAYDAVPIDANASILIAGRWWSDDHWEH